MSELDTQSQEKEFQLNDSYRVGYRRAMSWLVFLVILGAIFAVILAWMTYDEKQPAYYAAVTTGEVVRMHALSEPIVTSNFIIEWSALAVRRVYNLSFNSYQQQLNGVKDAFTPEGWEKMTGAMKGLISQLTNNRLVISSVVEGTPVILARLIINGRYTWRVQMKLLVTYTSANEQRQQHIIVTMNVQRVSTMNAPQGIQIIDFSSGAPV